MKYSTYNSSWYINNTFRDFSPPSPITTGSAFSKSRSSPPSPTVHALKPLPQADILTVEGLISQCNVAGGKLAYSCKFHACKSPEKVFMSKENARVHVQHELGFTNLYACTGCDAKFSSKDTAKRHVNSKMGGKQYPCQYCGTCFERKDYRATHVQHQKCIAHRRMREQEALRLAIVKTEEMESALHARQPAFHSSSPVVSQPPSPTYFAPESMEFSESSSPSFPPAQDVMDRLRREEYHYRQDAMAFEEYLPIPQQQQQQQYYEQQDVQPVGMAPSLSYQGYYTQSLAYNAVHEQPGAFYREEPRSEQWHRHM